MTDWPSQLGAFAGLVGVCVYLIRIVTRGTFVPGRELTDMREDRDFYRAALVEAVKELTDDKEFRTSVLTALEKLEDRDGVLLAIIHAIRANQEAQ